MSTNLTSTEIKNLEEMALVAADKTADFRAACKRLGAIHDLDPANIAAFVRAKLADRLDKFDEKQAQMEFLLETSWALDIARGDDQTAVAALRAVLNDPPTLDQARQDVARILQAGVT